MSGKNFVLIIGRLGKNPDLRYAQDGRPIANFTVATSEEWKDKQAGEKRENVEWHRVTCFGKLAEICGEWLKKGMQIEIDGRLQTRKWTDKEGNDRYTTEIIANNMLMLCGKSDSGDRPTKQEQVDYGHGDQDQENIPF